MDMDIGNSEEPPSKKYKRYNDDDLKFALREVKEGNISINKAAKKYKVPAKTISWRVNKQKVEKADDHRGASKILNDEEELKIANWLISSAKLGNPRTIDDLKEVAQKVRDLRSPDDGPCFKNGLPSSNWINDYLNRNKSVTFRKAEPLSRSAANVSETRIRRFFTNFYGFLEEINCLDVLNRPEAFYNVDESGFQLGATINRVLAEKGSKNVFNVEGSRSKEQITATFGFGADGTILPTQIIFKTSFSKTFDAAVEIGKIGADFVLSSTTNGWQTKESFNGYIRYIVEYLEARHVKKPLFITYDNHSSHLNYDLFEWCSQRDVHIVTFPPYTTHILQMCDVGIFGPAKNGWKKEVHNFKKNTGNEMDEISFIGALKRTMDKVITKEKVMNGFRATGIMPFDVNNVDLSKCIGDDYPLENHEDVPIESYEESATFKEAEERYHEQLLIEKLPQETSEDERADYQYEFQSNLYYPGHEDETPQSASHNALEENLQQSNETDNTGINYIPEEDKCGVNKHSGLTLEQRHSKIASIFGNMSKEASILNDLMKDEKDPIVLLNIRFMEQQFEAYHQKYSEQVTENSENPVKETVDEILKLPEKYRRKTNRVYKEKNHGIMTHANVIKAHKEEAEKLKQADESKVQKQKEKELKKEIRQNIIKIKKEKNDEAKLAPKKRGRPKKSIA